jgi:hypothetical protein
MALFDVAPIALVWFVFFPPAFYCRWVERGGSKRVEGALPAN